MTRMRCVVGLICLLPVGAFAGKGPLYHYGEAWWQEYRADDQTELLLHFGSPAISAREALVEAVENKRSEETLPADLDEIDAAGEVGGVVLPQLSMADLKRPPVDESEVPETVILDYSDRRRRLELPPGLTKTDSGRFGKGLRCDGSGGLTINIDAPQAVECSFRIDRYPPQPSCIFSVADDEARLLLHPDGRLELKLRNPHGNPGTNPNRKEPMTEEQRAAVLARDATIISPTPVALQQWVQVVVYNNPHPTPGGGEPWDARLKIDGFDVAWYLSERYNDNNWLGVRATTFTLGSDAQQQQGFVGELDEVRLSRRVRSWYERPPLPWRDTKLERPLQFNKPYFYEDLTVFHASLDHGLDYDLDTAGAGPIQIDLHGKPVTGMLVPAIRGQGWVIDPLLDLPRFPLQGIAAKEGTLEFWVRPVNWDDVTGYWHHSPPKRPISLSVARIYGRQAGQTIELLNVTLPRSHNIERGRWPVDPGHWLHCAVVWSEHNLEWASLYINGKKRGGLRRPKDVDFTSVDLTDAVFGVTDEVTVVNGERPLIEIDEVVGYAYPLRAVHQAFQRWQGTLEPVKLFKDILDYKFSLRRLDFSLQPLLSEEVTPQRCELTMLRDGERVRGPLQLELEDELFRARLNDGEPFPYGSYEIGFKVFDDQQALVIDDRRLWNFEPEAWRDYRGGIPEQVPPPWTPIVLTEGRAATRMSRFDLTADGLPAQILAAEMPLLHSPVRLREAGRQLTGEMTRAPQLTGIDADWAATFTGDSCVVQVAAHLEFDGMLRYTLQIEPRGTVQPLTFEIPMRGERASHYLFYPMGARGVTANRLATDAGVLLDSRWPDSYAQWRAFQREKQQQPQIEWPAYLAKAREQSARYGFFGHVDLNDRNRGLFWFCDNAAGWHQSKSRGAVQVVRDGDAVTLVLNLIAEPVDYQPGTPIVFALLPHPARPMPRHYRAMERAGAADEPLLCSVFDAFRPWPMDPRSQAMRVYPAADPAAPDDGPSWAYAESCIDNMNANKPTGYRTMYLSKLWFSCRTGAYDGWEWRSNGNSGVSLTPHFVDYLCWEMNEWIGRGIWNAIYLDECYEANMRNLEAGFSVRLPDGSEQLGTDNFQFRELSKRWRCLFHAHGKEPMMLAHHTHSWQYPGLMYFDAYLDGENSPIVSLNSRDWIDSTSRERFEVIQNSRLWGMASFYMPFIAEGGFAEKERSQFPRWQWRMARQAQSQFAHYEVATTYPGQGAQVYQAYWHDLFAWGARDDAVTFHPYWDNADVISVDDQGGATLVSCYRRPHSLLLIASNRRATEHFIRIKVNRSSCGLAEQLTLRELSGQYEPPDAPDFLPQETEKELTKIQQRIPDLLGGDGADGETLDVEAELMDDVQLSAQERDRLRPRLEDGDVVVVPVRARDYRLVVIE